MLSQKALTIIPARMFICSYKKLYQFATGRIARLIGHCSIFLL